MYDSRPSKRWYTEVLEFKRVRKIAESVYWIRRVGVPLSVCVNEWNTSSHWTDFMKISSLNETLYYPTNAQYIIH